MVFGGQYFGVVYFYPPILFISGAYILFKKAFNGGIFESKKTSYSKAISRMKRKTKLIVGMNRPSPKGYLIGLVFLAIGDSFLH